MRPRSLVLIACILIGACARRPSRDEAMAAFRAARPGVDSAQAVVRIWADGPPWFSCGEVIAKLKGNVDRAHVRDDIGRWRPLIVADWVTLRDTAAGNVVEPGWCKLTLHDTTARLSNGWRAVKGDSIPSGGERRGWDVIVGTKRVSVPSRTSLIGRDSARARFATVVLPNANGIATGADRDTIRQTAVLTKVDGRWRLVRLE